MDGVVLDAKPTENGGFRIRLHLGDRQRGIRKTWARHVTEVDTTERGGYAFIGEWVRSGDEVPAGAWVVVITASGTRTDPANTLELYQVNVDGTLQPILSTPYNSKEDVAAAIHMVAQYVNTPEAQKAQRDLKLYTALTALIKDYGVEEVRSVLEAIAREL